MIRFSIEHFMAWAVNHMVDADEAMAFCDWLSDRYYEDAEHWDRIGYAKARDAWYDATVASPTPTAYELEQRRLDRIYVNVRKV